MSKAVICIAKSQAQAETIVTRLESAGIPTSNVSVLMPDRSGSRDFAHEHNHRMIGLSVPKPRKRSAMVADIRRPARASQSSGSTRSTP